MNLYWDSCVFFCYLTGVPAAAYTDVAEFVIDAKAKRTQIYCSTVTFAEIRQDALKRKNYPSIRDFFADFDGAFFPIDPNPNIMIAAGELKDAKAINPSDAKTTNQRVIGTADAIHLATCLYIRDVMEVKDIVFHTFDDGKGKTWEGKCVPLLSFERRFPATNSGKVLDVCGLKRRKPEHPAPRFAGMTPNAAPVNPSGSA